MRSTDTKLKNIYEAIENGFTLDSGLQDRCTTLQNRKAELEKLQNFRCNPPEINPDAAKNFITHLSGVLNTSNHAESRKFIRMCVDEITLNPEELEVDILYKIPPMVGDKMVAGAC